MLLCHFCAISVPTVLNVQHGTVGHGSATVKNLCPNFWNPGGVGRAGAEGPELVARSDNARRMR
jgi:hypothetical protein